MVQRHTLVHAPTPVEQFVRWKRNYGITTMKEYRCIGCYAHLVASDAATHCTCPHCGYTAKLVMPDVQIEPISHIPFVVTQRQALKNCELALRKENRLPEETSFADSITSAQGIFLPCWLRSGEVEFDFSFDVDDGELVRNRTYGNERRAGRLAFSKVPASGCAQVSDEVMGSLGAYNLRALKPFSDKALSNFVTEPFTTRDTQSNDCIDRRFKDLALLMCDEHVTCSWEHAKPKYYYSCAVVFYAKSERALLPMWLLTLSLNGKKHLVAVNGQTGAVAPNAQGKKELQSKHRAVVVSYRRNLPEDALTFTLRESRLGPCQETNRWPPRNYRL